MYTIGIDLGGTNIAAGIVNDNYEIIRKDSVPTGADRPGEEIVRDMANLCKKIIADEGLTEADIEYIGIATPGTADSDTGVVVYANNLPFLDFPIADLLKRYINIDRVLIENDANAAAKGEAVAGAAKGYANSVMITLGTGVGGGIIIDNKVYSGFNHAGAELGHIVIEYDGVQCSCGRKGCWEAYSSATALIRDTERAAKANPDSLLAKLVEENGGKANGKIPWDAMQSGDPAGKEVIDNYIENLSEGIANIANIFQPSTIAIGGGVSRQGDNLINPLKEALKGKIYGGDFMKTADIVTAKLGNDAGIIGAAFLGK